MMDRYCPFCPQRKLQLALDSIYTGCNVTNYPFKLLHCEECDLYAVDPKPSNEIFGASRDSNDKFTSFDLEWSHEWNIPLIKFIKKHVQSGELLDLGCNEGNLLSIAENNGFHCTGVEIDEVVAAGGKQLGRNVIHNDFLKMRFDKTFDVIVMNHVLEHIPDFSEVPATLASILNPNGVILINIPYYHSWSGQILKAKWLQLAPFSHIWFYSKKNIEMLFSPYFKSIELFTDTSCEPYTIRTWNWKPLVKGLIIRFFRSIGQGDELRIILRNPIVTG